MTPYVCCFPLSFAPTIQFVYLKCYRMTKLIESPFKCPLAGDLTIGSSPACGIVLNGTGVLPVHCTVYRNDTDEILLVPEPEGRTLVDGNRVTEEVNLRQGAMLTVGKANYMRFNNPTEAELIRSTMGSNDRISMAQLDFTSNDASPTGEGIISCFIINRNQTPTPFVLVWCKNSKCSNCGTN